MTEARVIVSGPRIIVAIPLSKQFMLMFYKDTKRK
jgi:hypothetical protein